LHKGEKEHKKKQNSNCRPDSRQRKKAPLPDKERDAMAGVARNRFGEKFEKGKCGCCWLATKKGMWKDKTIRKGASVGTLGIGKK